MFEINLSSQINQEKYFSMVPATRNFNLTIMGVVKNQA